MIETFFQLKFLFLDNLGLWQVEKKKQKKPKKLASIVFAVFAIENNCLAVCCPKKDNIFLLIYLFIVCLFVCEPSL